MIIRRPGVCAVAVLWALATCLCRKSVLAFSTFQSRNAQRTDLLRLGPRYEKQAVSNSRSMHSMLHTSAVSDDDGQIEIPRRFRSDSYILTQAALIGILSGWSVAIFKLAIDALKRLCYDSSAVKNSKALLPLIPAFGGLAVGGLGLLGGFPPGLRGTVEQVDEESMASTREREQLTAGSFGALRKAVAAIFTLGTGCSLGPEGPSVELGMSMSRLCMTVFPFVLFNPNGEEDSKSKQRAVQRNRLLLSCGAAAGVAAGFNAPLAGVFFALEIVQSAFPPLEGMGQKSLTSSTRDITAILISSVISALFARVLLGNHLALEILSKYQLNTPLTELPLYVLLGAISGLVAFLFSRGARRSEALFQAKLGPKLLRSAMRSLPKMCKPLVGGALCGLVGLLFPQILFFGYESLNSLLGNSSLPTTWLLLLLAVKMVMTAFSAGSGLVGGTFAPSLFFGAMVGGSFHNVITSLLNLPGGAAIVGSPLLQLADVPAYAIVGAGSVLAALFRAPLTASLLIFELTRDYDVILPLMASAGVGSVVADIVEGKWERRRRDRDAVSWGDLADKKS